MPWQPLPSSSDPEPAPVADSVDRLVRSWGSASLHATRSLFADWAEIVGPQVAAHATPRSLRHGTLSLGVTDPGWATQLRFLEPQLLERIAEATGTNEVRAITVQVRST